MSNPLSHSGKLNRGTLFLALNKKRRDEAAKQKLRIQRFWDSWAALFSKINKNAAKQGGTAWGDRMGRLSPHPLYRRIVVSLIPMWYWSWCVHNCLTWWKIDWCLPWLVPDCGMNALPGLEVNDTKIRNKPIAQQYSDFPWHGLRADLWKRWLTQGEVGLDKSNRVYKRIYMKMTWTHTETAHLLSQSCSQWLGGYYFMCPLWRSWLNNGLPHKSLHGVQIMTWHW